jgi:hypothetical protein
VGLEGSTDVEKPLGLAERLLRGEREVVWDLLDAWRAVRQRPTQLVARPGVARSTRGVAVSLDIAGRLIRWR